MKGKKILIVDDDPIVIELISYTFLELDVQICAANNGEEGLRRFQDEAPDLVILDIMMPHMDGWQLCQAIRQRSDVPIIILTALGQDREMIRGLRGGADDYIIKPFSLDVLLARVEAALRRTAYPQKILYKTLYQDDYLTVDTKHHQVLLDGKRVKLSVKEYRILQ
ncbi:MAG: response regulator transcription factor [Chloroflexota bacterium]